MPIDNPNLIPPPSIGESMESQTPLTLSKPRRSWLWLVVVLCVVVGVGLGVYIYQQSIAPAPQPSPKPVVKASPATLVSPSPATPNISVVTPQSNTLAFPKDGQVRVYISGFDPAHPEFKNELVRLTGTSSSADLISRGVVATGDKMEILESGLSVIAGQTLKIDVFDGGDETKPGYGWIAPDAAQKCGGSAAQKVDASVFINWAKSKSGSEPLVSVECWADWSPNTNGKDTSVGDFNDYFVIVSYTPAGAVTTASPLASPSPSPSPSPSHVASPSPSPSPLRSPSPSPSSTTLTDTTDEESPSPRVTMPQASALPTAGVFEVTVGTIGIGLIFVLAGILGLLLI
jgi:hypothetical protein